MLNKPFFMRSAWLNNSVMLALALVLAACYWWPDADSYRISLFDPRTDGQKSREAFHFQIRFLNGDADQLGYALQAEGRQANLEEWRTYLGGNFSTRQIESLVYEYGLLGAFEGWSAAAVAEMGEGSENALLRHLLEKEPEVLRYLAFAQNCETVAGYRHWESGEFSNENHAKMLKLQLAAEAFLKQNPQISDFLRLRYGYQLCLLARYNNRMRDCIRLYESWVKALKTESRIRYWAMLHYAKALDENNRPAEAAYCLAQVFGNAPEKGIRAYVGFNLAQFDAALALAGSNEEKAWVYGIAACKNPGKALHQLKQVAALNPASPELDLLLAREINKLEDWLLTPAYTGNPAGSQDFYWQEDEDEIAREKRRMDLNYAASVQTFVKEQLKSGKLNQPAFWQSAAAQLAFLSGEYGQALTQLQQAESASLSNPALVLQNKLIRMLCMAYLPGPTDAAFEATLYPQLMDFLNDKQLESLAKQRQFYDETGGAVRLSQRDAVLMALASRYEQAGRQDRAGLLLSHCDKLWRSARYPIHWAGAYQDYFFYLDENANPEQLNNILLLMDKENKSPFEQWLCQPALTDRYRLSDLLGTLYLRQNRMVQALAAFKKLPEAYWQSGAIDYSYLDANPFFADFYSEHAKTPGDTVTFSKTAFVEKYLELQRLAETAPKQRAWYRFQLANAHYNTGYWGNSWMLSQYAWTQNWQADTTARRTPGAADYFGLSTAIQHYHEAARLSQDSAFSALCLRMAAKCEHRQAIYQFYSSAQRGWDEQPPQVETPAGKRLREQFPAYSDELIEDCTSFQRYIDRWKNS